MSRRVVLAVLACVLAAGCSEDRDVTGTSSRTTSAPAPVASAPPAAPAAETDEPSGGAPAFEADTSRDEQAAGGGPLSVTAVRVARQDGYDRVVFELDGKEPGSPGWRVEYDADPRAEGSGDPVDVEGGATLAILIDGAGYPFDTGVEEEASEPAVPDDAEVVADVVLGAVYEGVYSAWIGVSREAPFRVFRLDDPARVVVDIRHE